MDVRIDKLHMFRQNYQSESEMKKKYRNNLLYNISKFVGGIFVGFTLRYICNNDKIDFYKH